MHIYKPPKCTKTQFISPKFQPTDYWPRNVTIRKSNFPVATPSSSSLPLGQPQQAVRVSRCTRDIVPTFHAIYETPQVGLGCGWPATIVERWRGRENEKNKEMEDEASGTRGTQRHTNPRHPQPSFSLMIPVADCFIEKGESSLGKSFCRLSVYRSIFLPSILFRDCLFIYLFIFSYVSDSEEV